MSYGFKFFNDSSQLVIDNEIVKPWFVGRATFVSAEVASEIPVFSFTHGDNVTRTYTVYRITYTPPTVTSGVFYISLPPDTVYNKSYNVSSPFYTGNQSIYVYAAVNVDYLPIAADIPEVYCFSLGQITTAGSGYGVRLFNSGNQCVFDTTKSHLKIDPISSNNFDAFVSPNGGQQYLTPSVDYPAYFLPNLDANKLTYIDSSNFKRERYLCFFNQSGGYLASWMPKVLEENKSGTLPFTGYRYFNASTRLGSIKSILPDSIDHNPLYSNALTYTPGYNGGTFPAASYTLTLDNNIIQEGTFTTILCTVNTVNVPSGGQLRYTLSGTGVTASDFINGITNTFVINNNTSSFYILPSADSIFEQTELVTITITTVGGSSLVGIPQVFSLKNTNFYNLSTFPANVTSINEGEYIAITLNTLESSTSPRIVNYTLSQVPSSIGATDQPFDANDWLDTVTLGSGASVVANRFTLPAGMTTPSASTVFRAKDDFRVDGPKKLRLSIDDNPSVFVEFVVNDTSREYAWSISGPSTVNEGITYTYNVTTAAPTGTRAIIGLFAISGATESDLAEINGVTYVSGDTYYVTTTNGTGSFTVKFKADLTTEGNETFTVFLDKDMAVPRTRLADLGFNVTIVDTSLTPINWSFSKITGNPTTALTREGTTMVIRVQSTNVPAYPYTIYYRIASGYGITSGDTNFPTVGSVATFYVTSADQEVLVDINEDNITEGTESLIVTFYRDLEGTDIISGLEWQIVDAISVVTNSAFVVEGGTQSLTIDPNYLTYPYTVYGRLSGSGITASDFTTNSLVTETTLLNNNPVTLDITTIEDFVNEGATGEVVTFTMYSNAARTIQVGNSVSWTIGNPVYTFSRSFASVNENSNQVITISTNAVLPKMFYGKMTGTNITASDFSSPPNSTTFSWNVTANGQSIGLTMAADLFTETDPETVTLTFYTDTGFTQPIGNTVTWNIADTSKTPPPAWVFSRSPSLATVDEGIAVTIFADSTYVPSYPVTIYTKFTGSGITAADTNIGALQGAFVIEDPNEEFTFLIIADALTEGIETLTITHYSDSGYTTPIGNQLTFNIGDASRTSWVFTRTPATGVIDENTAISFTATPSNAAQPNTTIYYWLNGTGISAGDVVSASLEGSFNSNSGLTLTMRDDLTTEGLETAGITFYSDFNRVNPIGNTLSWSIGDTSLTPPSYVLSVSASSVNEDSSFSFNINSANVLIYPFTAWYRLSGTGITVNDTDFDPILGSVSVTGPATSFTINTTLDQLTEGTETLTFAIYSDSARTNQLGNLVSIDILDTSRTTWTFTRTPATGPINETNNNSILITAIPSNAAQPPITIYYWLSGNNVLDSDFTPAGTLGSFTSSSGLTITMAADLLTEGTEDIGITFYSNSSRTIQIGNTAAWLVNDTSLNAPVYNIYFFTPPGSVNEGSTTNIGVDSSYVPVYPVELFYKVSGTGITALDTNFPLSGGFGITGLFDQTPVQIIADQLTEGNETLSIALYSDAGLTNQVSNTASIVLVDQSRTSWLFTRSPATGFRQEGQVISFFATPSNSSAPAITVYYSISGIEAADLVSNSLTGSFNSSSGTDLTMSADSLTEGNQTATITFYSNATRTTQIGNTLSWVIEDTSRAPITYSFALSPTGTINENSSVNLVTTTTNVVTYPTTIYYTISGTGVTSGDTGLSTLQGSIALGSASHTTAISVTADQLDEGNETLTMTFYSDSGRSIQIGNTVSFIIGDTSTTSWTFSRAPISGNINETGTPSSIQISASPSNVNQPITILYYSISGISASDITAGSLTGSFASTAAPSFTMVDDNSTEGPETATISFFKNSTRTISAGNSISWTIGDTSLSAPTYAFTISPATVNEGDAVTVGYTFTNRASYEFTLYYQLSGTGVNNSDFTVPVLGSVNFAAATGEFPINVVADLTTEGTESVTGRFYTNAARTIQAGNTLSWNISDTSRPLPVFTTFEVGYPTVGMTTIPRGTSFWLDVRLNKANDTGVDITILIEYRVNSTGVWTAFETITLPPFYISRSSGIITNNATGPAATLNVRATPTGASGGVKLLNLGW
jgi:hypothetical protein